MSVKQHSTDSETPLLHSQLDLPPRAQATSMPRSVENYESLWTRVNRICDQYVTIQREQRTA